MVYYLNKLSKELFSFERINYLKVGSALLS